MPKNLRNPILASLKGNENGTFTFKNSGNTAKRSFLRVAASALTAIGLVAASAVAPSVALASPDAGKIVRTKMHVDSPHAFWEGGNFVLRSHAGNAPYPLIEDTVNWVGKGYYDNKANYIFTVPSNGAYDFLGKRGAHLYMSPQLVSYDTYAPTWQGVGADSTIPVANFRSEEFTLDLMKVNGPGTIELFSAGQADYATRYLSSTDPRFRSYWMKAGTHTHNVTSYTKPGRYEVTYRVSARGKDGQLIQSKPQTTVYQIGGTNPEGSIKDVVAAYNNSNAQPGDGAGHPTFTMAPKADVKNPGDDLLTTMTVKTGNEADQGTVVYTIDGYHLAEVALKNGVATWDEMIGDEASTFQAMYIPTSGPTARWLSAPLNYIRTQASASTDQASNKLVDPKPANSPEFPDAVRDVTGDSITLKIHKKDAKGKVTVELTSNDPNFHGRGYGGGYSAGYDSPDCEFEVVMGRDGSGSATSDPGLCDVNPNSNEKPTFKMKVTAHPMLAGKAVEFEIPNYVPTNDYTVTKKIGDGSAGDDTGSTTTNPSNPSSGSADTHNCTAENKCVVKNGNVQLLQIDKDDKGGLKLGTERPVNGKQVKNSPNVLAFQIGKDYKTDDTKTVGGILEPTYLTPEFDNRGSKLVSYLDAGAIASENVKNVKIVLDEVKTPADGKVYAYHTYGNDIEDLVAGLEGPKGITEDGKKQLSNGKKIAVEPGKKLPFSLAFNKPGIYSVKAHVEAVKVPTTAAAAGVVGVDALRMDRAGRGQEISSDPVTYEFYVDKNYEPKPAAPSGDKPGDDSGKPGDDSGKPGANLNGPKVTGKCTIEEKCVFKSGHTDIFHASSDNKDKLYLDLKEDITGSGVTQKPEAVILSVERMAWTEATKNIKGIDKSTYALPMIQDQRLLWPGWETFAVENGGFEAIDIHLDEVTTPDGGQVYAFMPKGAFGADMSPVTKSPTMELKSGDVIPVPYRAHSHLYWAFSKEGIYKMKVHVSGKNKDGKLVESNTATYTWYVNKKYDKNEDPDLKKPEPVKPATGDQTDHGKNNSSANLSATFRSANLEPASSTNAAVAEKCLPVTERRPATPEEVAKAKAAGATLVPSLKDDRSAPAKWVDPSSLVFGLGSAAKTTAPAGIEFIASSGSTIYMIGSTQIPGVPWLGANTQHESIVKNVNGGVTWTLKNVSGPGKLAVFESGNFGKVVGKKWFDNVGGPTSVVIPHNTHVHPNWVFTAPGDYTVTINESATTKDGKAVSADTTLHFKVGGSGNADSGHFDLGAQLGEGSLGNGKRLVKGEDGKYYIEETVGRTASGKACKLDLASTGVPAEMSAMMVFAAAATTLGLALMVARRRRD